MPRAERRSAAASTPTLSRQGARRRRIAGDLDAFTAQVVEPPIRRLIESRPIVLLDLSGVRVLTSGGLAMLERMQAYAAGLGRQLMMVAPPDGLVLRVLRVSGLPREAILVERRQRRD